ncbi:MAG TPA: MFS transporter, partial [Nitriliruptoraceae bacterium]|nr:MFS transporter [Nitriliruptoraceae bacterium]
MGRFRMVHAAVRERPALGTLAGVYGAFKLVEEGAWIAMTILAHGRGGVGEASAVVAIQLVPAMLVALTVGRILRRSGGRRVLVGGLAVIAVVEVCIGALVAMGAPSPVVYAAAAVAASAFATIRPAVASLLPWLVRRPRTLTTGTVLLGWMSGAATLAGPAIVAVVLGLAGASIPFFVFGGIALAAAGLAARLPRGATRPNVSHPPIRTTVARLMRSPGPRLAIAVVAVYAFVLGFVDVAVVVVASDALGVGDQFAGWFGAAVGAGMVIGTVASVLLVGRRWLWPGALVATCVVV